MLYQFEFKATRYLGLHGTLENLACFNLTPRVGYFLYDRETDTPMDVEGDPLRDVLPRVSFTVYHPSTRGCDPKS